MLQDLKVHQFARTLFEEKRRSAGARFEEKLARFQHLNSICALAQRKNRSMNGILKNFLKIRGNSEPVTVLKENPAGPSI